MNNSKMWLVVKPTVGIPLFLSAVAIGSFAVHVAVLTHTSWVSDFLSGQPLGSGDAVAASQKVGGASSDVAKLVVAPEADGTKQQVFVLMPDGSKARLVFEEPTVLAAMDSTGAVIPDQ